MTRDRRLVEAVATAGIGGLLGAGFGSRVGLGRAGAFVGAANGAVSGWRGIYDWRAARGVAGFVLDSTWALTTTSASLASHAISALRGGGGYDADLSRRRGRHVYRGGFRMRRGFLITVGNVVSGAGDTSEPRRARLVDVHEDVHVWQARWLGPLYPALYAGWMAVGGAAGAIVWLARGRREPLARVVETCAYYLNPFEWWAYSRDDHWPPAGKVPELGPDRPVVPASIRARAGTAASPR